MIKWIWPILIPSLLFAERPDSLTLKSMPVFIDVGAQVMTIFPEQEEVSADEIRKKNGTFSRLLDEAELKRKHFHIVLFLRPGSVNLHRQMRQMIQDRNLNVGFEPLEANRDILQDIHTLYINNYPAWSIEYWPPDVMEMERKIRAKDKPCEVEVYADHLIILTNNTVVTQAELQTDGNAFDQWLNQCGNTIQCWYVFCQNIGSDKLYALLQEKMYERGKESGAYIKSYSTPLEVPPNGRTPIYVECRENQLFEIKVDGQSDPTDIPRLLTADPGTQFICFLVRPDSFEVFRKARKEAWMRGIDISCELQSTSGPLAIGADGHLLHPERSLKHNEAFEQPGPEYPPQGVGSSDP